MKISVILMVENEDYLLNHWYENVLRYADEIIIGYVGDNPPALPFVKFIKYPKDTPVAKGMYFIRNDLIRYATGDWIISLDADEVLATTREHLEPILSTYDSIALQTCTHCTLEAVCTIEEAITKPVVYSGENHTRIFRNIPGMHWIGVIHEELYYQGSPVRDSVPLLNSPGLIHYGPSLNKEHRHTVYGELTSRQYHISGLQNKYTRNKIEPKDLEGQQDFWKQRNGIIYPTTCKNMYGSHRHILALAIDKFKPKHILEIGVGQNSTEYLHSTGIKVSSYETNKLFQYKQVNYVSSYDQIPNDNYDLVFIDHAPTTRRNVEIDRFRDRICVVHDTQDSVYEYYKTIGTMKYVYTDCTYNPWTTVCSDTLDVTNLSYGFNTYVPVDWRY